jgi:hypothetical protein
MLMGSHSTKLGHPLFSKLQTGRRRCLRLTPAPLSILARLTAVPARQAPALALHERRRRLRDVVLYYYAGVGRHEHDMTGREEWPRL